MKEQISLSLSLSFSPLSPMFTRVQARITRSQAHYSPTRSSRREECTKIDEYTSVFLRTIFSFISLPQRKKREGPLHYIGYVKNLGEKTETTMTTRGLVGKRERTGATVFMDMVVNMLTGFGMCVVCVRKYAFYVFGFIGRPLVSFFRIFPKVDKVDLARSSQNRGLRFYLQMYVLAEKRAKNFKFKKRKNSLLLLL